ncbi:ubiquinol-cytochrome C chaperone family protein [Sphingomonas canadensis]|uniref:Ubiquinol-cytochrome C chaperone family protein n=1 Tax=Sphingomonas canadensis TaxID=1219257 RepID=A0ABW3H0F9_9SPHN|nr:ubiquinol-cytochrome C chaperone family protein [Sphingomonas canadensis]MCW3835157.1 ubiquinol-cytochrome C chaperone [Sphingomonas canadensis]
MALFERLFGRPERGAAPAIYAAMVARGREPHWYVEGAVPDSIDGRFDMIAAVLCMLLLRLEQDPVGVPAATMLAECFIDDMDAQLREIGVGDVVIGKHMGKMMGMLGGRLGAFRDAMAAGDLKPALVRNLWRGEAPDPAALAHVERALLAWRDSLATVPVGDLAAGRLPG